LRPIATDVSGARNGRRRCGLVFVAILGHNQPPTGPIRNRRDSCWLRGHNPPVEASQTDRAQAEGRLKLPDLAEQTRPGSRLLSLSQHAGQARRRTSPAKRPRRALRGTPERAPNLQLFSRRFAQRPLRSWTLSPLSRQPRHRWAVTGTAPSVWVLQWARHISILSLLTSRDFCCSHSGPGGKLLNLTILRASPPTDGRVGGTTAIDPRPPYDHEAS